MTIYICSESGNGTICDILLNIENLTLVHILLVHEFQLNLLKIYFDKMGILEEVEKELFRRLCYELDFYQFLFDKMSILEFYSEDSSRKTFCKRIHHT